MYTEEQFQKDNELITKFLYIYAGTNGNIIKYADASDQTSSGVIDYFKDLGSKIYDNTKQTLKEKGLYGLASYLITGTFGPMFKILSSLVSATLGLDLSDILKAVVEKVGSVIKSKGTFTQSDADEILNVKTANSKPFYQMEKDGKLHILARELNSQIVKSAGISDMFLKGLSRSSKGQKTSFGKTLLRWLFKIVLTAIVGIISVEGVKSIVDVYEDRSGGSSQQDKTEPKSTSSLPSLKTINFKPSGWGETYFLNSGNNAWFVPLVGTPENTLYQWVLKVYPEIKDKRQELINSKAFNTMASILGNAYDSRYPGEIQIPQHDDLHTIKDIVDHSVSDIV